MASLRDVVRRNKDELRDGIAWVAFWKEGRSWQAEYFWLESEDDSLCPEDKTHLEEIQDIDPSAVVLNGYYCGYLSEEMNVNELAEGVRWHYENSANDIANFIDEHKRVEAEESQEESGEQPGENQEIIGRLPEVARKLPGQAMEKTVYAIFEGNMARLEKKLNRIFNKCKAYGCDFRYEQVGETFKRLKDENGNEYTARFILVEAEGTAVMNNWEFVASVEHTKNGNILTGIQGIKVPERYYTGNPVCEHCNSNRYRKYTYIVRNKETGEFKQVGRSCLKDFTYGMSAEAITQYISLFDTLIEGETPDPGCHIERYLSKEEYLAYAAETIRHFGYIRTGDDGRSTASRAMDYYQAARGIALTRWYLEQLQDEMEHVNFNIESPETVQLVKEALDWIGCQSEDSTYMHNLKTVCGLDYVTYKNFGLLASLFPAYNRDLEKTAKRKAVFDAESGSEYVGKVKDRIMVKVRSVKCVTSWETDYGITRVYKIIGENGNVYTWKTGKFIDDEESANISIIGTIKAHTEFRGIKQTELTRCRIAVA